MNRTKAKSIWLEKRRKKKKKIAKLSFLIALREFLSPRGHMSRSVEQETKIQHKITKFT